MADPLTMFAAWAALAAVAALASAILRAAGCPGAAVLGGVVAGALLGASIAGRVWPELHERAWTGGSAARLVRQDLLRQHERDRVAAAHAGLDAATLAEMAERQRNELRVADDSWTAARWSHQRGHRTAVAIIVGLALMLGAGAETVPRRRPHSAAAVLSLAGWAVAVPGLTGWLVFHRTFGDATDAALLAAAALAIGPLALAASDRAAADEVELGGADLVRTVGLLATLAAVGLAAAGFVLSRGLGAAAPVAALAAVGLGWLLPPPLAARARVAGELVLLPLLAATAMVPIDAIEHADLWPIVAALIISGDGRWLGATLGGVIPGGRGWMHTMRLTIGVMNAAPGQLAVVALAVHWWALPPRTGLALILGALLIAMAAPVRRWMSVQLAADRG